MEGQQKPSLVPTVSEWHVQGHLQARFGHCRGIIIMAMVTCTLTHRGDRKLESSRQGGCRHNRQMPLLHDGGMLGA